MNRKKYIALLLIPVLVLAFSGCGKAETVPETTQAPEIASSAPLTVTVTIPEGTSCSQIAQLLEQNGVCPAADFLTEANNPENLSLIPFAVDTSEDRTFLLEGFLFPDTYEFYSNCTAKAAIKRFLDNLAVKIKPAHLQKADELGYTFDEIITLASIIQEEAGDPKEMNKVSSVIHNRLDSPDYPYVQCDVAIKYLENYVKPYFTPEDYEAITYNYNIVSKRKGLPAGAITNPGISAIEAALYPADTDYYYFVTDSDANYYYAETYSKHCDNCRIAGIAGY